MIPFRSIFQCKMLRLVHYHLAPLALGNGSQKSRIAEAREGSVSPLFQEGLVAGPPLHRAQLHAAGPAAATARRTAARQPGHLHLAEMSTNPLRGGAHAYFTSQELGRGCQ
jgi:hypothetical protein